MKPIINVSDLEYESHEEGPFSGKFAAISEKIGAKKLGYSMTICPPGKKVCPFHNHHINEEVFFILEGEGELRFGDNEYPLRAGDFIACPPGTREVAHQIINTGTTDLKYLSLSTNERNEICEYPDSNKVGVFVGDTGKRDFRKLFKIEQAVPYMEGEEA